MTTAKEDRIIVLREFGSEFNANLALNLLQEAGINAQLLGTDWPGVQGVPLPGQGVCAWWSLPATPRPPARSSAPSRTDHT